MHLAQMLASNIGKRIEETKAMISSKQQNQSSSTISPYTGNPGVPSVPKEVVGVKLEDIQPLFSQLSKKLDQQNEEQR